MLHTLGGGDDQHDDHAHVGGVQDDGGDPLEGPGDLANLEHNSVRNGNQNVHTNRFCVHILSEEKQVNELTQIDEDDQCHGSQDQLGAEDQGQKDGGDHAGGAQGRDDLVDLSTGGCWRGRG